MRNSDIKLSVLDVERKYNYEYEEVTYGTDSIVSYGKDNNAPILFKNCYRNSATLKSIIDGNVNYILGDNIEVSDEAASWREKVNRTGMTMRQFVANLAQSFEMYGGFAFQVIFNKLRMPVELFPMDFSRCRTNEYGTKVFYSKKNWSKWGTKSTEYEAFNPSTVGVNENYTQVYYYKGDYNYTVYPLPPFFSAIKDILTEIECANYSLNSVSSGFSAKYILNMPKVDNLTDEQKQGIEDAIKNKFCGSDTDANFMLYWQDGDEALSISKIESDDAPEKFIAIKDNARTNIFTAMRATPNLFGLPTATTGFNSQEYADAFKLYEKTVIEPVRDVIKESIDKVLNIKDSIKIIPFSIQFNNE